MIKDKIKTPEELGRILSGLRERGKKIVFTNGCFDIMHAGHALSLEEAKSAGDCLVVAVNSDSSVKRLKGPGRPVTGEADRMKVLAALGSVDFVTMFHEADPGKIIERLSPDIIAKGADWKEVDIIGADSVKKKGGKVVRLKFLDGYSSTDIIDKIRRAS